MHSHRSWASSLLGAFLLLFSVALSPARAEDSAALVKPTLDKIGVKAGLCAIVGDDAGPLAIGLAKQTGLLVYVQVTGDDAVAAVSTQADKEGLLGRRVWVAKGPASRLNLADNLADAIVVTKSMAGQQTKDDLFKALAPGGKLVVGDTVAAKPFPKGSDDWSHPYHLPDNNPLSADQQVKYPYMTQFLAEPWYGPMLQVTVASGGRVFKAFGHLAVKAREQPWLCTLVAMNGNNGTIQWKRALSPGFMIHRNTLVATPTRVYLGDDASCKVLDSATGELKEEITAPRDADGPVWKWMAVQDGILYALVGEKEYVEQVHRLNDTNHGWGWKPEHIGDGYYKRPYPWGMGRTLLAIDLANKKVLWTQNEDRPLDGRAICMRDGRLYAYSSQAFLSCRSAKDGKELWRSSQPELLAAIGPDAKATMFDTGWSSSAYMKCTDKAIYFAGPQRTKVVAASTENGKLLWSYDKTGNFQLVLRPEAVYAMGAQSQNAASFSFDPLTGKVLADLGLKRRACTRATGTLDSIFIRGFDGTGRFDLATQKAAQIKPMRPACTDGVIIANGKMYWGPWLCDCNLSLIGTICLAPAGGSKFDAAAVESERLESAPAVKPDRKALGQSPADWPTYRADNARTAGSSVAIPEKAVLAWTYTPPSPGKSAAPVAVGGLVFVSGADGAVRALDAATGAVKWTAYTGGPILYPPSIADGRALVGSGDGWVYCLEAATGELCWQFRAAPAERRIPVYGSLASTWPVASGVLVDKGVAYAACGIANYDGTHVYALDAATGRIRWQNNTSGGLDAQQNTGVSVQGHLLLAYDRLYLAGGNLVSPAAYDIRDGKFVGTELQKGWRGKELFLTGGQVRVSGHLLYAPDDDCEVGARRMPFGAYASPVYCALEQQGPNWNAPVHLVARPKAAASTQPEAPLWQKPVAAANVQAIAVAKNAAVVAWLQPAGAGKPGTGRIEALDLQTGHPLWQQALPARPVDWGLAIDRDGRVLVALRDGRVLCFAPER